MYKNIKDMTEEEKLMLLDGYCRCANCNNYHNLEMTSSSNWVYGVCSDGCLISHKESNNE